MTWKLQEAVEGSKARVAQEGGVCLQKSRSLHLRGLAKEDEAKGQIEPNILDIWGLKTRFTLAPSRALVVVISKRLSTRTQKLHSLSYMIARTRW